MTKRQLIAAASILSVAGVGTVDVLRAQSGDAAIHEELRKPSDNKIAIRIEGKMFTIDLYDNATAGDLVTKLPLTVKVSDYPGYDEKLLRLKEGLSMKGAPKGDEPEIPEVGYYEPGRWIALYYGPIGYWPGKVPLGRIHASVDEIRTIPESASVTIENIR
ncbi:cyclophilin-like fold protein [Rhizobium sp. LEGMi135b]